MVSDNPEAVWNYSWNPWKINDMSSWGPRPHSLPLPSPVVCVCVFFFQCHLLRTKFLSWVSETWALHKSEVLIWPIQGQQLLQGVGWGWRAATAISVVSRELLLEGPWGLPPSVLHNLSLENCKFISQKGLRAEMSSKRTNHFLQSLTELRLGGRRVWPLEGGSIHTCPTLLPFHRPLLAWDQESWSQKWAQEYQWEATS